jgi:magnesium-protoporphyrin O-methyltransferase
MPCACATYCDAAERQFTKQKADAELQQYRAKGAGTTTRRLRDALTEAVALDGTLLDIGAGIGALTFELLDRGVTQAIALDASAAYVASARAEAERRAVSDRVRFIHADFVGREDDVGTAAIVTMDRVVCCFPSYEPLLGRAVRHAERAFAYSYPRDRWYVRLATRAENATRRKGDFRTFVHPPERMERIIQDAGFELVSRRTSLIWSIDVFARTGRQR